MLWPVRLSIPTALHMTRFVVNTGCDDFCTHVCMHTRIHVLAYACRIDGYCLHVSMRACAYMCVHACACVFTRVSFFGRTYVCRYAGMPACTCVHCPRWLHVEHNILGPSEFQFLYVRQHASMYLCTLVAYMAGCVHAGINLHNKLFHSLCWLLLLC